MPPEFFLDRNLGRRVAEELRQLGWIVHRIAEVFPADAQNVPDEDWIRHGLGCGWVPLSKDGRIKTRDREIEPSGRVRLCCSTSTTSNCGPWRWSSVCMPARTASTRQWPGAVPQPMLCEQIESNAPGRDARRTPRRPTAQPAERARAPAGPAPPRHRNRPSPGRPPARVPAGGDARPP